MFFVFFWRFFDTFLCFFWHGSLVLVISSLFGFISFVFFLLFSVYFICSYFFRCLWHFSLFYFAWFSLFLRFSLFIFLAFFSFFTLFSVLFHILLCFLDSFFCVFLTCSFVFWRCFLFGDIFLSFLTCFFVFWCYVSYFSVFCFFFLDVTFRIFLFFVFFSRIFVSCISNYVREASNQILHFSRVVAQHAYERPWFEAILVSCLITSRASRLFLCFALGNVSQNGVRAQSRLGVYFEWIFSRPKHVCRSASGAALPTLRPKASGLLKENPTHTMYKRISIYGDLVGHGFCFAGVSPVQEFKQTRTGPTENYVLVGPLQWGNDLLCVSWTEIMHARPLGKSNLSARTLTTPLFFCSGMGHNDLFYLHHVCVERVAPGSTEAKQKNRKRKTTCL